MKTETMKRIYELCELLEIKTISDLERFKVEYQLVKPTGEELIAALEMEVAAV